MPCLQVRIQRKDTAGYTHRNKALVALPLFILLPQAYYWSASWNHPLGRVPAIASVADTSHIE